MTAPHHADPPAAADAAGVARWDPEPQYIGALLWLPAPRVRPLLNLVPDTVIEAPLARWAYELIAQRVGAGGDPNPVTVLQAGRCRAAAGALHPDRPPGDTELRALARYLIEAYTRVLAPAQAVGSYAAAVLDGAYRRRFAACGIRMQQAAAGVAGRAELTGQLIAIRDELADLRRRAERADPTTGGP
jgi:hypothetical protein